MGSENQFLPSSHLAMETMVHGPFKDDLPNFYLSKMMIIHGYVVMANPRNPPVV